MESRGSITNFIIGVIEFSFNYNIIIIYLYNSRNRPIIEE